MRPREVQEEALEPGSSRSHAEALRAVAAIHGVPDDEDWADEDRPRDLEAVCPGSASSNGARS